MSPVAVKTELCESPLGDDTPTSPYSLRRSRQLSWKMVDKEIFTATLKHTDNPEQPTTVNVTPKEQKKARPKRLQSPPISPTDVTPTVQDKIYTVQDKNPTVEDKSHRVQDKSHIAQDKSCTVQDHITQDQSHTTLDKEQVVQDKGTIVPNKSQDNGCAASEHGTAQSPPGALLRRALRSFRSSQSGDEQQSSNEPVVSDSTVSPIVEYCSRLRSNKNLSSPPPSSSNQPDQPVIEVKPELPPPLVVEQPEVLRQIMKKLSIEVGIKQPTDLGQSSGAVEGCKPPPSVVPKQEPKVIKAHQTPVEPVKPVQQFTAKQVEPIVKPTQEEPIKPTQEDIKLKVKSIPPLQPVIDAPVKGGGSTEMRKRLRSHSSSDGNEPVVKKSRQNSVSNHDSDTVNRDDITTGHRDNEDNGSSSTVR